jgi:soluble lytic murein transglycosylase
MNLWRSIMARLSAVILLILTIIILLINVMKKYDFERRTDVADLKCEIEETHKIDTIQTDILAVENMVRCIVAKLPKAKMENRTLKIISYAIYESCKRNNNLTPQLLCATITWESAKTWDPKSVSRCGALGLMQVMPATGTFVACQLNMECGNIDSVLFDPAKNIRIGSYYLSTCIEACGGVKAGLAAYNGGPARGKQWAAGSFKMNQETLEYVPGVMTLYNSIMDNKL